MPKKTKRPAKPRAPRLQTLTANTDRLSALLTAAEKLLKEKPRRSNKKRHPAKLAPAPTRQPVLPTELRLRTDIWDTINYLYGNQKTASEPDIDAPIRYETSGHYIVDVGVLPKNALALLLEQNITSIDREKVLKALMGEVENLGIDALLDRKCVSLKEMSYVVHAAYGANDLPYNVEVKLAGRYYPMKLQFNFCNGFFGQVLRFSATVRLAENAEDVSVSYRVYEDAFRTSEGDLQVVSVRDVMLKAGMRPLNNADQKKMVEKALRAREVGSKPGRQVIVLGDAMAKNEWSHFGGSSIEEIRFGSAQLPRRAIVEPELELPDPEDDDHDVVTLPLVRIFSMDLKRYVYVDVDDINDYASDASALDKLVLPENIKGLVRGLFESHVDDLFGDILSFKHGGMIICAAGPTGVGKTLTAECFAEHTGRPLYPIELGELGTKLDDIEDKLRVIFGRAKRWNAVLLLDEADVIFQRRDADLERSAIVGVFLRLLDYYSGFLFLTTNRLETLDPAFESRITLTLRYSDLSLEARARIWENMLKAAGIQSPVDVGVLAAWNLNGRRIRSLVRLLRTLHGRAPTKEQVLLLVENVAGGPNLGGKASSTNGRHLEGDFTKGLAS